MRAGLVPVLWVGGLVPLAGCGEDYDVVPPHAVGAEQHRVVAADGGEIVLTRYPAPGDPVVLCHGVSSNHHFWDLEPGRSLALYLNAAGFDVWNLDLRGHGFARVDGDGRRQRARWSIDDYGVQDLPAALAHVQASTDSSAMHFVGHSMGGMVLAVYLADHPDPPLASAVAVASPLDFRDPDPVTRVLLGGAVWARPLAFLPTPGLAKSLAGFGSRAPLRADDLLYNPDNIHPDVARRMLRRVVSPLSRGEIRQLGLARHDGEFRSADGSRVYREHLGGVTVPMLFIAGRADRIVQPDHVRTYWDAVGSPDKELVIASTANGFAADYGHLGYGVGDTAERDVFPRIEAWLSTHEVVR